MRSFYPKGPASVPPALTKPSFSYKRQAWLATAGVLLFLILYLGLAGWFSWTAYRFISAAFEPDGNLIAALPGVPALFFALFMFKALFFVKRGSESKDIRLDRADEPVLFEFLDQLAADAGAPKPKSVYLSPRVNAAVFYDLSILNLIFPSKKNLEIGLGLVNVLNLGEFKAVLAHEFGHFAQRSMAIGSWVYIAHQVAAHVIVQRDIFDKFLEGLSRFDLRIAWVGWLLRLVIWSIRSIMDSVFRVVVLAHRALSREMEFQADLVAVSLTGSDALVHALHKLNAADDAWARTMDFVSDQARSGRCVGNIFQVQQQILARLRQILSDPNYGSVPPVPESSPESHRVFTVSNASQPQMWSTHPESSAREQNAKKWYIGADIDQRSAWSLFNDRAATEQSMLEYLLPVAELTPITELERAAELKKLYGRAQYHPKFQGVYLGRVIARHTADSKHLYDANLSPGQIVAEFNCLYPESLRADLQILANLVDEKSALQGIYDGKLTVNGGVITYRGETIKRNAIPAILEELTAEISEAELLLSRHDKLCRTVHLSMARELGGPWYDNLTGMLDVLHFASHSLANIRDVYGLLNNVVAIVTADKRVTKKELQRLLKAANQCYEALEVVYENADQLVWGSLLEQAMAGDSWRVMLGELKLSAAGESNINNWMAAIHSWVATTCGALQKLEGAALDELLKLEASVAKNYFAKADTAPPEIAPSVNFKYQTLAHGEERKRQLKLNLWERFYTADGWFADAARFAVAACIVGLVVFLGQSTGAASVTFYNGLDSYVDVDLDGQRYGLAPHTAETVSIPAEKHKQVAASINGTLVESFEVDSMAAFSHYVYNIGQAAAMIEWTQVYGDAPEQDNRYFGAPRWFVPTASVLFAEPPDTVSTKSGGATRTVLAGLSDSDPDNVLSYINNVEQREQTLLQHASWDAPESKYLDQWLTTALEAGMDDILRRRLSNYPADVSALRLALDYATSQQAYDELCNEYIDKAAQNGAAANYQYVAIRCLPERDKRAEVFVSSADQFPRDAWLNYAAAYAKVEQGQFKDAENYLLHAMASSKLIANEAGLTALRLFRINQPSLLTLNQILYRSDAASTVYKLDTGEALDQSPNRFFSVLAAGSLGDAAAMSGEMSKNQDLATVLLGSSSGASASMINNALAVPADAQSASTALLIWSLGEREHRTTSVQSDLLRQLFGSNGEALVRLLSYVSEQGASIDLASHLKGLDLQTQGLVYAASSVVLGESAPSQWKLRAKQLLFAHERPYFSL